MHNDYLNFILAVYDWSKGFISMNNATSNYQWLMVIKDYFSSKKRGSLIYGWMIFENFLSDHRMAGHKMVGNYSSRHHYGR